jgi:hypothetical protein
MSILVSLISGAMEGFVAFFGKLQRESDVAVKKRSMSRRSISSPSLETHVELLYMNCPIVSSTVGLEEKEEGRQHMT